MLRFTQLPFIFLLWLSARRHSLVEATWLRSSDGATRVELSTTSFPSDAPSLTPSLEPSHYEPTSGAIVNSLVLSDAPSDSPSQAPSSFLPAPSPRPSWFSAVVTSSDTPSLVPSIQPSLIFGHRQSDIPSTTPSLQPSLLTVSATLSDSPSLVPSWLNAAISTSDSPSLTPSIQPSLSPASHSKNPSDTHPVSSQLFQSDYPSIIPSVQPSSLQASVATSDLPSLIPSIQPSSGEISSGVHHHLSDTPSLPPSEILQHVFQSDAPSLVPSLQPSLTNAAIALSDSPSLVPSIIPSLQDASVVSDPPSLIPSIHPSSGSINGILNSDTPSSLKPTLLNAAVASSDFPSLLPSIQPSLKTIVQTSAPVAVAEESSVPSPRPSSATLPRSSFIAPTSAPLAYERQEYNTSAVITLPGITAIMDKAAETAFESTTAFFLSNYIQTDDEVLNITVQSVTVIKQTVVTETRRRLETGGLTVNFTVVAAVFASDHSNFSFADLIKSTFEQSEPKFMGSLTEASPFFSSTYVASAGTKSSTSSDFNKTIYVSVVSVTVSAALLLTLGLWANRRCRRRSDDLSDLDTSAGYISPYPSSTQADESNMMSADKSDYDNPKDTINLTNGYHDGVVSIQSSVSAPHDECVEGPIETSLTSSLADDACKSSLSAEEGKLSPQVSTNQGSRDAKEEIAEVVVQTQGSAGAGAGKSSASITARGFNENQKPSEPYKVSKPVVLDSVPELAVTSKQERQSEGSAPGHKERLSEGSVQGQKERISEGSVQGQKSRILPPALKRDPPVAEASQHFETETVTSSATDSDSEYASSNGNSVVEATSHPRHPREGASGENNQSCCLCGLDDGILDFQENRGTSVPSRRPSGPSQLSYPLLEARSRTLTLEPPPTPVRRVPSKASSIRRVPSKASSVRDAPTVGSRRESLPSTPRVLPTSPRRLPSTPGAQPYSPRRLPSTPRVKPTSPRHESKPTSPRHPTNPTSPRRGNSTRVQPATSPRREGKVSTPRAQPTSPSHKLEPTSPRGNPPTSPRRGEVKPTSPRPVTQPSSTPRHDAPPTSPRRDIPPTSPRHREPLPTSPRHDLPPTSREPLPTSPRRGAQPSTPRVPPPTSPRPTVPSIAHPDAPSSSNNNHTTKPTREGKIDPSTTGAQQNGEVAFPATSVATSENIQIDP